MTLPFKKKNSDNEGEPRRKEDRYLTIDMTIRPLINSRTPIQCPNTPSNIKYKVFSARRTNERQSNTNSLKHYEGSHMHKRIKGTFKFIVAIMSICNMSKNKK